MLRYDSFGVPYWGRSVTEEIAFRVGGFVQNLPTFIPLGILVGGLLLASRL